MKDIGIYVVFMGLFLLGCTSDKTSTETQPAESEIVQEEDSEPSPISSEAKDSKDTPEEVVPNDATEEVDGEVVEEVLSTFASWRMGRIFQGGIDIARIGPRLSKMMSLVST